MRATVMKGSTTRMTTHSPLTCTANTYTHTNTHTPMTTICEFCSVSVNNSPLVCVCRHDRLVYQDDTCKQLTPMEEGEEVEDRRGGGWQSPRRVFLCPTSLGVYTRIKGQSAY